MKKVRKMKKELFLNKRTVHNFDRIDAGKIFGGRQPEVIVDPPRDSGRGATYSCAC